MPFSYSDISQKASGGTELMCRRLEKALPEDLLDQFQIIPSRVRELDNSKYRIFYCHDLPNDPESAHLANEGWKKFHKLVFVSNWQMQSYIAAFNIPWSRCVVIENAIESFPEAERSKEGPINLIYHTTPHRGLDILLNVYDSVAQDHDVILDVYSSFGVYGWQQRDAEFEPLFKICRDHPRINYHGAVDNSEVRVALQKADIFAYPCTWPETSCLALIEAMSAGCVCIYPNFGALFETGMGFGQMYQWNESKSEHAKVFEEALRAHVSLLSAIRIRELDSRRPMDNYMEIQKNICEISFTMGNAVRKWTHMMNAILTEAPPKSVDPGQMFSFNTNKR